MKKIKLPYRTILKYSFLPGLILTIAGLVAGLIANQWSPLYIGLLVAGSIFLLAWLIFIFSSVQGFWGRRSTQAGTNALVATLSLVAILGLINFLAVRYSLRVDVTENQLFTLSPQTQEIVRDLQQTLKVVVFTKDTSSLNRELLNTYRRYNSNFQFEFIDPQLKPGIAEQFNVRSLGDIYLEYQGKKELVQTVSQGETLSESKLTNAIEKIQRDRVYNLYFLQGNEERPLDASQGGLSQAISSLKEKGYRVEPLNLIQKPAIPADADVIIIAGPKRKFFAKEVQLLQEYSRRGGNLLLAIDPKTEPGLEPLLKDWGVELDNRVIIDPSGAASLLGLGPTTAAIDNYGQHPITEDFANVISFYPLSRAIKTVKVEGVEAVPILIGREDMWGESNLESEKITPDANQDLAGPFDLGVALTRQISAAQPSKPTGENTPETPSPSPSPTASPQATTTPSPSPQKNLDKEPPQKIASRLVVIGNSAFATDGFFQEPRILNGDFFLNSVQWLASGSEQPLSIRPKEPENRRINLKPWQARTLAWLSLAIVPLFALVMAVLTWWRRR